MLKKRPITRRGNGSLHSCTFADACIWKCVYTVASAMASRGARCARARGGQRDVEYLEGTRIERSRRAINIHDLYIVSSRAARVRDSFARGCVHTRACVHARVRYSRLPKLQRSSRRKRSLLSSCFSASFSSSSSSLSIHIRPLFKRNGGSGGEGETAGFAYIRRHTLSALISPTTAGN